MQFKNIQIKFYNNHLFIFQNPRHSHMNGIKNLTKKIPGSKIQKILTVGGKKCY